jgi:PAS domain S-box-containing protein
VEERLHVDDGSAPSSGVPAATADGLHGFAAASPDLACITDTGGTVTSVNPAWRHVLGWTHREVVGRSLLGLIHPDDVARTRSALDEVLDGRTVLDCRNRWPHADGGWCWISWSSTLSPDGRLVYASGRDINERVEHAARATRNATELEVALSSERAACDELRDLDRRKDTFLSAVSHQLRGPLAMVRGAAETLAGHRGSLSSDEAAELDHLILEQSGRLATVLDELLNVDRMGRGKLTAVRRPTDLVCLVRRVIARSTIEERVSLTAPDELVVAIDAAQIENVVDNLLTNVAKYAPDGAVAVTLVREGGRVRIAVLDQGPGIPPSSLQQVFEPFRRLDEGQHPPGTGIGLALVAEFARLHGGRAWAEPETGGAHLVVELPDDAT